MNSDSVLSQDEVEQALARLVRLGLVSECEGYYHVSPDAEGLLSSGVFGALPDESDDHS